jgi:trigger factor
MINQEIDQLAKQAGFPESAKGSEPAAALKTQLFGPEARRRVALGLLISRLVATQQIKPDEAHVRERLASIASTYEEAAEVVQWYGSNPQALKEIRAMALEDQVVDWLLERAAVSYKPSSFDEIMRPAAAAATSAQE